MNRAQHDDVIEDGILVEPRKAQKTTGVKILIEWAFYRRKPARVKPLQFRKPA